MAYTYSLMAGYESHCISIQLFKDSHWDRPDSSDHWDSHMLSGLDPGNIPGSYFGISVSYYGSRNIYRSGIRQHEAGNLGYVDNRPASQMEDNINFNHAKINTKEGYYCGKKRIYTTATI